MSPSTPSSGWRGYFLPLKAVCIFWPLHRFSSDSTSHTHFVALSLPPASCLIPSLLPLSFHSLHPPFQALTLANWHPSDRSELSLIRTDLFPSIILEPCWVHLIPLSTQLQPQHLRHQTEITPATFWQWAPGGSVGGDGTDWHRPLSLPTVFLPHSKHSTQSLPTTAASTLW